MAARRGGGRTARRGSGRWRLGKAGGGCGTTELAENPPWDYGGRGRGARAGVKARTMPAEVSRRRLGRAGSRGGGGGGARRKAIVAGRSRVACSQSARPVAFYRGPSLRHQTIYIQNLVE